MEKIKVSGLGTIQETLLIPLYGRALESKKAMPILKDTKSAMIVDSLDYPFHRFSDQDSQRSLTRTTIRTAIIDQVVNEWIDQHPNGTIVELGCGLNTRFERTDNGKINWYDLDLPDVYNIWQQFFSPTDRRSFLACSAFDLSWMQQVAAQQTEAILIISEASVIYFDKSQVMELFQNIAKILPGAYYLFDSTQQIFIDYLGRNDALKYCSAKMKWALDEHSELESWVPGLEFLQKISLEAPSGKFSRFNEEIVKTKEATGGSETAEAPDAYFLNLVRFNDV
ncbi:MAG: class I SAM-dependent methyltransferase [Cyclobacteriaceae bacterium]